MTGSRYTLTSYIRHDVAPLGTGTQHTIVEMKQLS